MIDGACYGNSPGLDPAPSSLIGQRLQAEQGTKYSSLAFWNRATRAERSPVHTM